MRCKRLPGLPVLAIETGEQLGRIRRVIFEPAGKRVFAFLVRARSRPRKMVLPMEKVHALGGHAVTVRSASALEQLKDSTEAAALLRDGRAELPGLPAVTESGEFLGAVRDVEVAQDGAISSVYIVRGFWQSLAGGELALPGESLVALGKDALVVGDMALLIAARSGAEPPPDEALPEGAGTLRAFRAFRQELRDRLVRIRPEREEEPEPPGKE